MCLQMQVCAKMVIHYITKTLLKTISKWLLSFEPSLLWQLYTTSMHLPYTAVVCSSKHVCAYQIKKTISKHSVGSKRCATNVHHEHSTKTCTCFGACINMIPYKNKKEPVITKVEYIAQLHLFVHLNISKLLQGLYVYTNQSTI